MVATTAKRKRNPKRRITATGEITTRKQAVKEILIGAEMVEGAPIAFPTNTGTMLAILDALGYVSPSKVVISQWFAAGTLEKPPRFGPKAYAWHAENAADVLLRLESLRRWRPESERQDDRRSPIELYHCRALRQGDRELSDFSFDDLIAALGSASFRFGKHGDRELERAVEKLHLALRDKFAEKGIDPQEK